jgi:hypothetical protein
MYRGEPERIADSSLSDWKFATVSIRQPDSAHFREHLTKEMCDPHGIEGDGQALVGSNNTNKTFGFVVTAARRAS